MAKRKRLRLVEVDLISFVDKGDNPLATVVLAKRAEPTATKKEERNMADNDITIDLDTLPEPVQEAFKALTGRLETMETALSEAKANAGGEPPVKKDGEGGGEGGEGGEGGDAKGAAPTIDSELIMTALREALGVGKEEGEQLEPVVAKAMDEVQQQVQKAQDEAKVEREKREELEKRFAEIEASNRRQRFIKMATDLKNLPEVTADDFGVILDKAEGALEDAEFERLQKVLKGADEAIATSKLFTTVGSDGDGSEGGAVQELNKRATAQKEADPKLTIEQAKDKVLQDDPELAKRLLEEEEKRW